MPGLREPDHKCPAQNRPGTGTRHERVGEPAETPTHRPLQFSPPDLQQAPLESWGGDREGKGGAGVPKNATAPPEGQQRHRAQGWGLSVQGNPHTQRCCSSPTAAGGALCPPDSLDAASVALGDTEAGRAWIPVPVPRGHPVRRRRKGSGWDSLPAGCRRKRGRKGLAGAPQRRDVATAPGAAAGGGHRGSPRAHPGPR